MPVPGRNRWRGLAAWAAVYLVVGFGGRWIGTHYLLVTNESSSLPDFGFVVRLGTLPHAGDYVAFRLVGDPFYGNVTVVKKVGGVAGDVVTALDRTYFVDGRMIGRAKPISMTGVPLKAGPLGTIPTGQYFVYAPNKDSYDSRYANIGWIPAARIVGVAHPVL